jgi:hypothetical protein
MGVAGFLVARLILQLKRLRGQLIAAGMLALLSGGLVVGAGVISVLGRYL